MAFEKASQKRNIWLHDIVFKKSTEAAKFSTGDGPFIVKSIQNDGSFKLSDLENGSEIIASDRQVARVEPWNYLEKLITRY